MVLLHFTAYPKQKVFMPAVQDCERTGSRLCLLAALGEVNRKATCLSKKHGASCSMGCTDVDALRSTAGFLNCLNTAASITEENVCLG